MKKLIYILIIAFLTISCEKTIEFKGEATAPMLVFNSIISPDSTIVAEVSQSRFFLEDKSGTKYIENADLRLIVNGADKGKLIKLHAVGTYGTDYRVSAGDEVKIEVNASGFTPVSSSTTTPFQPAILNVDTSSTSSKVYYYHEYGVNNTATLDTTGEFTNKNIRFNMKFRDNGSENNYYRLIVKVRSYFDKSNSGGLIDDREYIERYLTYYDDVVFGSQEQIDTDFNDIFGGGGISHSYNTFSDELFNGKEYDLKFSDNIMLNYVNYKEGETRSNPEKTVYLIYLQAISADYYLYIRSMVAALDVGENPFVEPVQVRSNIQNGIGIFGSYTSSEPYVIEFRHK